MKNKKIIDIRYYETEKYQFERSLNTVGKRFARKLHELDFKTVDYDHIYINLMDTLEEGQLEISTQEDWYIYVNVGVSVKKFNRLNLYEKETFIIEMTSNVLRFLGERDGFDLLTIKKVEDLILRYKTELEIVYKAKETTNYKVIISYQIRPLNNASISYIEYIDKITGVSRKKVLTVLKTYEDIFYLVSSISVYKDVIILKSRVSSISEFHLRSYRTPIEILIKDLLNNYDNEWSILHKRPIK
jgi:hypothetical protein